MNGGDGVAVVVPEPGEEFVVSAVESPELALVTAAAPERVVRVTRWRRCAENSPSDGNAEREAKPQCAVGPLYDVEVHDRDNERSVTEVRGVRLWRALAAAANLQGFDVSADGEPHVIAADSFTLDPNGRGGLVIADPETHLPIHLRERDGIERRVRLCTDEEFRAYGDRYYYEHWGINGWQWSRHGIGSRMVDPPTLFRVYFPDQFDVWTPDSDHPLGTFVDEVNRPSRV